MRYLFWTVVVAALSGTPALAQTGCKAKLEAVINADASTLSEARLTAMHCLAEEHYKAGHNGKEFQPGINKVGYYTLSSKPPLVLGTRVEQKVDLDALSKQKKRATGGAHSGLSAKFRSAARDACECRTVGTGPGPSKKMELDEFQVTLNGTLFSQLYDKGSTPELDKVYSAIKALTNTPFSATAQTTLKLAQQDTGFVATYDLSEDWGTVATVDQGYLHSFGQTTFDLYKNDAIAATALDKCGCVPSQSGGTGPGINWSIPYGSDMWSALNHGQVRTLLDEPEIGFSVLQYAPPELYQWRMYDSLTGQE